MFRHFLSPILVCMPSRMLVGSTSRRPRIETPYRQPRLCHSGQLCRPGVQFYECIYGLWRMPMELHRVAGSSPVSTGLMVL